MTATLIVLAALLIAIPLVALMFRAHRPDGIPSPPPFGVLVGWATRAADRPYGPDTDRVVDELTVLSRSRRRDR